MVAKLGSLSKSPLSTLLGPIRDWRKGNAVQYRLNDILFILISGVVSGCDNFVDISDFYEDHEDWFLGYVSLEKGRIPSHDTYRRICMKLKPKYFSRIMQRWLKLSLAEAVVDQINIDGKCLRGARNLSKGERALYMVSAWASNLGLTLAMEKVEEKTNEIKAIPDLLDGLDISGAIVSIDAMGTQKDIAAKIREGGGHYLLALKGNQSNLEQDVKELFGRLGNHSHLKSYTHQSLDKGHGRVEIRKATVIDDLLLIREVEQWKDLNCVIRIEAETWLGEEKRTDNRYYISSLSPDPEKINLAVRNHWKIENSAHWVLDVIFEEDKSTLKTDHAPENLAFIRRIALNLLKIEKSNISIRRKRKRAARKLKFLENILFG